MRTEDNADTIASSSSLLMLFINDIKEELSYAYLHAIGASAGFSVQRIHIDRDSVDALVGAAGRVGKATDRLSPRLEVQLKATVMSSAPPVKGNLSFDLPMKNYRDLSGPRMLPAILMVLVLPSDKELWLSHSVDSLVSRRCAYWASIRGLPPVKNRSTRRVKLDCEHVVSPESLRDLMTRVAESGADAVVP